MNAPLTAKDFATYRRVRWRPGCGVIVKQLLFVLVWVITSAQTSADENNTHTYYFEEFGTPDQIHISRPEGAYIIDDTVRINSILFFLDGVSSDWNPITEPPPNKIYEDKAITLDFVVNNQKICRLYFYGETLRELPLKRTLTEIEQATFISLISENLEL